MASRALTISGLGHDLSGVGASWTIRMPIVVQFIDAVWQATRAGNTHFLQNSFSQHQYSPYIVDEVGWTLLTVSAVPQMRCRIDLLSEPRQVSSIRLTERY